MYMKNIVLSFALIALIGISPTVTLAQDGGMRGSEEKKNDDSSKMVTLDSTAVACIKSAVIKREDALVVGFDVYASSIKSARVARKDALSLAWDKTVSSERRLAVKVADKTFAESTRNARKTWNTARRTAWKTFEADRRACNVSGVGASDTGNSGTDSSL